MACTYEPPIPLPEPVHRELRVGRELAVELFKRCGGDEEERVAVSKAHLRSTAVGGGRGEILEGGDKGARRVQEEWWDGSREGTSCAGQECADVWQLCDNAVICSAIPAREGESVAHAHMHICVHALRGSY
eukprot:6210972-Pleurochrysis_carterae.AAC.4